MAASPSLARLRWPQAKLVHYYSGGVPASSPSQDYDLSLTDPASISLALLGGCEAIVETGGVASRRRVVPGGITLCGPEPIRWLGGSGSGAGEFIEITASPGFRTELAEELGVAEHHDLDDIHGWTDPIVWAVAARFRSAARETVFLDDLEADLLLRRLYARVLEVRFGGRPPGRGHGALDKARLERVLDFVEAHLEEALTTDWLSGVAALSPFHFVRAFRLSTGLTPHRYVRARRLERARDLLASGAPAGTVARRVGYESISHFRAAYRTHFGATYQRDRQPGRRGPD